MQEGESLKKVVQEIYEKLKENPSQYGFHISYSPESSWSGDAKFLILTMNPQAKDSKGKCKKIIPKSPWPKVNDFFDEDNIFKIKRPVQAICYELSRLVEIASCKGDNPLSAARNFADNCAIIASAVPFRTENAGEIDEQMHQFARDEYWGEILKVWQPEVIVALGKPPFEMMEEFLNAKFKVLDKFTKPVQEDEEKALQYYCIRYGCDSGKNIILIGLPHPAAHGVKGLPTDFPNNAASDSPCRHFLEQVLKSDKETPENNSLKATQPVQSVLANDSGNDNRNWNVPDLDPLIIDKMMSQLATPEIWQYNYDPAYFGNANNRPLEYAYLRDGIHAMTVEREAIILQKHSEVICFLPSASGVYPDLFAAAQKLLDDLRQKDGENANSDNPESNSSISKAKEIISRARQARLKRKSAAVTDGNPPEEYLKILQKVIRSTDRWKHTGSDFDPLRYTCPDEDIEFEINIAPYRRDEISCSILDEENEIRRMGSCEPGDDSFEALANDVLWLKTAVCHSPEGISELLSSIKENQDN